MADQAKEMSDRVFASGSYHEALNIISDYVNITDSEAEPERPDLTDGQTYEEIRELAPEMLPEEKPSLMEQLKTERPEHEARQTAPPVPERER